MRIGLLPLKTELRQPELNLRQVVLMLDRVREDTPDLVCLPECTLTGYLYQQPDLERFAEPVQGPTIQAMSRLAYRYNALLCFGMLELSELGVYNTAILLDRMGSILGLHRKIVEKRPFINGDSVGSIATQFGGLGVLICGDLFDDTVVQRLDPGLRLLIVLMARSFDHRSPDPRRWEAEERQAYINAAGKTGIPTALVNALDVNTACGSFGGAMFVSADGSLAAESPHGTDEVLIYDLD